MRRNDVVMIAKPDLYRLYGRVVRIIGDKALWICCGLHIHLTPISMLEKVDYVGTWEWANDSENGMVNYYYKDQSLPGWPDFSRPPRWRRPVRFQYMPTLRKLKQMATRYHKRNVWKTPLDYEYLTREDDPSFQEAE
jgi:hypothetical protein